MPPSFLEVARGIVLDAPSKADALDLPWADRPEPGSPGVSIFDCYGQRVAAGLRRIDAEAIVERMNAAWEAGR